MSPENKEALRQWSWQKGKRWTSAGACLSRELLKHCAALEARVAELEGLLRGCLDAWKYEADQGDGIDVENAMLYDFARAALATKPAEKKHKACRFCLIGVEPCDCPQGAALAKARGGT